MTDPDAELHAIIVDKVFPRLGETGTSATILALLDKQGRCDPTTSDETR